MLNKILLGVALLSYCMLLSAQEASDQDTDKLYITDQLKLSLYTKASSKSKVIKLLKSGDLLKIREPFYNKSDHIIDTTSLDVNAVVDKIIVIL